MGWNIIGRMRMGRSSFIKRMQQLADLPRQIIDLSPKLYLYWFKQCSSHSIEMIIVLITEDRKSCVISRRGRPGPPRFILHCSFLYHILIWAEDGIVRVIQCDNERIMKKLNGERDWFDEERGGRCSFKLESGKNGSTHKPDSSARRGYWHSL